MHFNQTDTTQLTEEFNLLDNLLDQVPVYLAYVDKHLIYKYVSKAYASWFGLSKNQVIGKHVKATFDEKIYSVILRNIKEVLKGKTVTFETKITKPDGSFLHVLSTYIPYYNNKKEIIAFTALMRDVTDISKAINECKISEQIAMEKKEELERFFTVNLDMLCIADLNGYFLKLFYITD